ncbi:MAG: O-antigen ligase family protein [Clostridia bacterium]|nr:O-antigen ligase family protein [Clostridia bacterium]
MAIIFFVYLCGVILILSEDIFNLFMPLLMITTIAMKFYDSADLFVGIAPWLVMPVCIGVLLNFLFYHRELPHDKVPMGKGTYFSAMLFTSIAVSLGGLGLIKPSNYFKPFSLLYILGLGFGMLLVYIILTKVIKSNYEYDLESYFANVMILMTLFIAFELAKEYVLSSYRFDQGFGVISVQWRNNAATLIMAAMPFSFYMTFRNKLYFIVPLINAATLFLMGSRGGVLFGIFEFFFLFISMFLLDKKSRKILTFITAVTVIVLVFTYEKWYPVLYYSLYRFADTKQSLSRIYLWKQAIKDFVANPVFGAGISNEKNVKIYGAAKGSIPWAHNSVFQIIGSMGIMGVVAYIYLFSIRVKTIIKNRHSLFKLTLFLSYLFIELMSLVNPGIFSPFPYLLMVTIYFVLIIKLKPDYYRDEIKVANRAFDKVNYMKSKMGKR